MRRSILCVLAASFVLVTSAAARVHTGKVGGRVLRNDGRPAGGVQVVLERSDGSAPVAVQTNSSGRFLFKFVRSGFYDIRAGQGTTATIWKHNVMVHPGKETALDLRLEPIRVAQSKPRKP